MFIVASRYRAYILLTGRSRDHKFRQCFPWQMRTLNTGLPVSVFEYFIYEIRKRYRRPWKPAKERCNRDKFFLGPRPRVRKPHKHVPRFFFVPSAFFFPISISSYTVMLHFVQWQMRGVWRQMQLEVFGGRRVRYARWRWLWLERQVSAKAVSITFCHESCSISLLHCIFCLGSKETFTFFWLKFNVFSFFEMFEFFLGILYSSKVKKIIYINFSEIEKYML